MKPIILIETNAGLFSQPCESLAEANAKASAMPRLPTTRVRVVTGEVIPAHWDGVIASVPAGAYDSGEVPK